MFGSPVAENKVDQTQGLPDVVQCAGFLGALERELDRRGVLASVCSDFGEYRRWPLGVTTCDEQIATASAQLIRPHACDECRTRQGTSQTKRQASVVAGFLSHLPKRDKPVDLILDATRRE